MLPLRKIIHVDMDAFYASVEQRDCADLRGKPVAVGGSAKRGVVAAASYEARKYGVHSAMSSMMAKRRCPELIFVQPDFEKYRRLSQQIHKVFFQYTDLVEPLSLDEAYLDVTQNKKGNPSASLIAKEIRAKIKAVTQLNASAGISINKFLAKIASDVNKPNGQKTIPPEDVISFLEKLEIKDFHGVGKVTTQKMYRLGIFTGQDLKTKSAAFLTRHFGKAGQHYYEVVRGIHLSPVKPHRIRKSLSAEHTFMENISSEVFMTDHLKAISASVERRLAKHQLAGKTVTLKIKYSDFSVQTRSKTLPYYIATKALICDQAKALLYQEKLRTSVRLLGISVSNLNTETPDQVAAKESVYVQLKLKF